MSWFVDRSDNELMKLVPLLENIVKEADDVRYTVYTQGFVIGKKSKNIMEVVQLQGDADSVGSRSRHNIHCFYSFNLCCSREEQIVQLILHQNIF